MSEETAKEFVERMQKHYEVYNSATESLSGTEIDRLLSLALRGAETQWRPIEEAPKDGRRVFLGNEKGCWMGEYLERYQSGFRPEQPWKSAMLNHRHMPSEASWTPTHFIPLSALGEPK